MGWYRCMVGTTQTRWATIWRTVTRIAMTTTKHTYKSSPQIQKCTYICDENSVKGDSNSQLLSFIFECIQLLLTFLLLIPRTNVYGSY